jgi:hypothetical protein
MNRKLLIGSAVALFVSACDADKITDANNNPNSPTNAPSEALFTNAARLGATRWLDGVGGTRYGFLPQHFAQVQYPDDDQYLSARLGPSVQAGLFDGSYSNELQDLRLIRDRGVAANTPGLWGPAVVLSAWEFGVLTDVYGDVPFRQAFDPAVLRPAYDSQTVIYDSLFAQLTAASTALGTAANELGTGDPIFAGDPASWRRLANSLRLRHAMRLYNVDATRAAAQAAAAIAAAGGMILTNAQNAAMAWPGDGIYDNPWANNFKGRDDHRISERLLTVLSAASDPRLPIVAMEAEQDTASIAGKTLQYCTSPGVCYSGLVNALTQATASPLLAYTSRPGAIWYPGVTAYGTFGGPGKAYPSYFMTAAEVEFLLAEAAERGVAGAGVAATHYANGVTRHMEMLGVAAGSITTFLAGPGAFAGATTAARQTLIATQKWVAMMTDPLQAWFDVRRTCVPAIVEPGPNARFDVIPRRLQYSSTEAAVNSSNRSAAVTRQFSTAGDVMTARIYLDPLAGWTGSPTYVAGCSSRI